MFATMNIQVHSHNKNLPGTSSRWVHPKWNFIPFGHSKPLAHSMSVSSFCCLQRQNDDLPVALHSCEHHQSVSGFGSFSRRPTQEVWNHLPRWHWEFEQRMSGPSTSAWSKSQQTLTIQIVLYFFKLAILGFWPPSQDIFPNNLITYTSGTGLCWHSKWTLLHDNILE